MKNYTLSSFLTLILCFLFTPQFAQTGEALNFGVTEKDYVEMKDFKLGTADFTIECWVKMQAYGVYYFVTNRTSEIDQSGNWFAFGLEPSGLFAFQAAVGGAGILEVYRSNSVIPLNQWQHIAITRSSSGGTSTFKVYLNGDLDATHSSANLKNFTTTYDIGRLGGWVEYNSGWFSGEMDEVRIWNQARSEDDIADQRSCELTGSESNLIAYYQFNQGIAGGNNSSISNLLDLSGSGNNGMLNAFSLNGNSSNWVEPGPLLSCNQPPQDLPAMGKWGLILLFSIILLSGSFFIWRAMRRV